MEVEEDYIIVLFEIRIPQAELPVSRAAGIDL